MGDLVQAAETFISKNFRAVLESADFLQFCVDDVKAMLKLEIDEHLINEDKFKSLVLWTNHDINQRRKHFADLFHLVQLNSLSMKFLNQVVYKEKLVHQSAGCADLHATALFSQKPENIENKEMRELCQSDEILVIGGVHCPQSVVKFNTKTKQWSDMPNTNIARFYPSAVN